YAISVPSSSGRRARQKPFGFSRNVNIFQSPLHRGAARGSGPLTGGAVASHFSPLFIGAPRAAEFPGFVVLSRQAFQSPLHRGAARGALPRLFAYSNRYFSPLFIGAPRAAGVRGSRARYSSLF